MHPRSRQALPHLYYPPGMYQTRINPRRSGYTASTLLDDLANWWDLLGNANDSIGGDNLSTSEAFTGTAPSGDTNCIQFDGTGGASIGAAAVTSPTKSAITIGLWFRQTNTAARSLFYYGSENYTQVISSKINYRVGSSASQVGTITISTNTWYCLIFSADASGWAGYVNNSADDSDTHVFDFTPAATTFDIGAAAAADWQGQMCCCAIWDRILTADERTEFYNAGVNLKYADL